MLTVRYSWECDRCHGEAQPEEVFKLAVGLEAPRPALRHAYGMHLCWQCAQIVRHAMSKAMKPPEHTDA